MRTIWSKLISQTVSRRRSGRMRQSQMITQGGTCILAPKNAALLQNRNDTIDKILQAVRQGIRHKIEAVGGTGAKPLFYLIGNLFWRADQHPMTAATAKRIDQLTHGVAMLACQGQRRIEEGMVAVAAAGQA